MAKKLAGKEFYEVMGRFSERYTKQLDKYDVSLWDVPEYVGLCKEEMACNDDKEQVDALCYGTWLVIEDYIRFP